MGVTLEPSSRFVTPRLVGRRAERTRLVQAVADSRRDCRVVLIEGEAGIGKSRLLDEIVQLARASGHRVMIGGCVSLDEDVAPLAPIAEALRGLASEASPAELSRLLGATQGPLSGLVPGLVDVAGRAPSSEPLPGASQQRFHTLLIDLVTRLARDKPLVLVVEDIHWADSATLELLTLLARNLRASPFALLLSCRTDEAEPSGGVTSFVAELERLVHPEHVRLRRFSRGEVLEQLAAIRGVPDLRPELVDAIARRSDGNPFFIEELSAAPAEADGELPSTLDEVLQARLAELSEASRQLVAAAAVRPRESSEGELQTVAGLDEDRLVQAIHELLDRKIFERRRVGGREVIAFRHALIKAAAYTDLLPSERRRLHVAYAALLESEASTSDPFTLAELAAHWEAAGDVGRALAAALRAGESADAAYQPALASEQYERAVRLLDRAPADAIDQGLDRVAVLDRAARAAASVGSARSIDYILSAIDLVDAAADPVRAGLLRERLGRYRWYAADGEGALVAYREAVNLVPKEPPTEARARVTAGLAQLLMILARFEESTVYCEEALVNSRAVGARTVEAHATDTMGVNVAYLGDPDRGVELLWAANAMANEVGDVEEVARTYANLVDVLLVAGQYEDAAALGLNSFDYCVEHGLEANYGASLLAYAAWGLHILGRWPEAMAALARAQAQPLDTNSEIVSLATSAIIEAGRGDFEASRAHIEIARPLIAKAIDIQLILPVTEAAAEYELATSQPALALSSVLEGIARSEPVVGGNVRRYGPVYALGLRAAADICTQPDVDQEKRSLARADGARLMAAMEDAHRQISTHHAVHLRLSAPFLALCRAEWTRVDGASDPAAWASAAEQMAQGGRPYVAAYARWRQAEAALETTGRAPEVGEALAQAYRVATDLGAQPLRSAIESLARRARVRLGQSGHAEPGAGLARFGLTQRELEVLRLLAAGKTNRQIGAELFISDKTASVHVSNLLSKLGVARRSEAAALAARVGITRDEAVELEGGA